MPERVLLDTNILIHREAATVVRPEVGPLFKWFDRLGYEKCVHPTSVEEIDKHRDPKVRISFRTKLSSYHQLQTLASIKPEIQALGQADLDENDRNDTKILNELFADRVDYLITEDKKLAEKAAAVGVAGRVFTINGFLEKVALEHPSLVDYKVLTVRKMRFGDFDVRGAFFDSFREDYGGAAFDRWFNKKSDEPVYVCTENGKVVAFLYVKVEDRSEGYPDIEPSFGPKKRLKIGTLKVALNSYKIGERLLKIVFDNAVIQRVDEIYVTIFERTEGQRSLVALLERYGFVRRGVKHNAYGDESVLVRSMARSYDTAQPRLTFPYVSRSARAFLVPIYPDYHTSLLPDSILRTESSAEYGEHAPYRNAIRKVYVSRSIERGIRPGDVIVFYRTKDQSLPGHAFYQSVVTTLGIVDEVHLNIASEDAFVRLCRSRSVFGEGDIREQWRYSSTRPFVVGFLYAYSFPNRPNLKQLIENGVIASAGSAPRGFVPITPKQLGTIMRLANVDTRFVVD